MAYEDVAVVVRLTTQENKPYACLVKAKDLPDLSLCNESHYVKADTETSGLYYVSMTLQDVLRQVYNAGFMEGPIKPEDQAASDLPPVVECDRCFTCKHIFDRQNNGMTGQCRLRDGIRVNYHNWCVLHEPRKS